MEFTNEKLSTKESDYLVLRSELERLKEDNLMLKAAVKEGDKNREVLARQMTHAMKQELQLSNQQYAMSNDFERERPQERSPQYAPMPASRDDYSRENLQIKSNDSYGVK